MSADQLVQNLESALSKIPLIDQKKHVVVKSAHPSPFSEHLFFGTKPFSKINDALTAYVKDLGWNRWVVMFGILWFLSDFLGDIAVICMKPDHGKRIAHQLQALGIPPSAHGHPQRQAGLRSPETPGQHPVRAKQQGP